MNAGEPDAPHGFESVADGTPAATQALFEEFTNAIRVLGVVVWFLLCVVGSRRAQGSIQGRRSATPERRAPRPRPLRKWWAVRLAPGSSADPLPALEQRQTVRRCDDPANRWPSAVSGVSLAQDEPLPRRRPGTLTAIDCERTHFVDRQPVGGARAHRAAIGMTGVISSSPRAVDRAATPTPERHCRLPSSRRRAAH